MSPDSVPQADLERILSSARRLGVELDEADALQWLAAVAAGGGGDVVVDDAAGVFGHRVSMLDFSPEDLAHFRAIGRLVGFDDAPGVETALALSGSAAQSKIQTYPGDCDYFERINILAPTREEACRRLASLMREKALATLAGPTYRLIEVKFGNYPRDLERAGRPCRAGTPIAWKPAEIVAGKLAGLAPDGSEVQVAWEDVAHDPGWCKLDWVVADPVRRQVRIISHLPAPFMITEYRTNIPDRIEVALKPEVPDKVYVLEVRPKGRQSGRYAGVIELFTNSRERPRLIVRVLGEIYLPSAGGQ